MNESAAPRALLSESIDYAGLFPPATLPLEAALKNFADYMQSDDAWMLSTFVLPMAEFPEALRLVTAFDRQHSLRISALGPKTTNDTEFAQELTNALSEIPEFAAACGNVCEVGQLEMPLPPDCNAATLTSARELMGDLGLNLFFEAPASNAHTIIPLLAENNSAAKTQPFGFKFRTGGVTAGAFPTSAEIARALLASIEHNVPIKFTAGLHHPIRMFRNEVKTKMHGFLNVFGAGVLAREEQWDEEQTIRMLKDEDPTAFGFTHDAFRWRDHEVGAAAIEQHRALITSFGSCSFDEPREDLRALNLL